MCCAVLCSLALPSSTTKSGRALSESMAKPRKPRTEETKPDNSGALVRHQKLCLSIDMDKRLIYGYTELEIAVPDIGIVGLHAENLGIESVFVDGEPTEFEYYPHTHPTDDDKRWSSVSSPTSAADFASSSYLRSLERELVPNLLINCCKASFKQDCEQPAADNAGQSSDPKLNVKLVRINYWVEKAETGIHFDDNVMHTDNQIRRARCWFPCMDDNSQRCCYDLEFTVAPNLVAVSTGSLLYQVLSKDDPPRKTYVYRLNVPVAAQWISLAVASFEIVPDSHIALVSHMCLPDNILKLQNTVEFFHNAFSHYENYLSVKFPFGSYKQVFVAPEMAISPLSLGASMSIFSSQILFDEKIIDQTISTWIKLAYALARQWFGVYITPDAPEDEWLLDGLAGFLADTFIKQFLGNNEARYRRYKANCAVCRADDTGVTALSSTASCKDLYGTQCIGLYGKIRSWKSVAILQMLEKQMGPEYFRKILQTIVSRAHDTTKSLRSLSTKEFRHFANKIGNLERPFLKEFFPRWVGSCGCPVLRMGLSYNKRKNMIELAVLRGCTAIPDSSISFLNGNSNSENRDGDIGWPGMMSIRVHELDNTSDYPILPMAGDSWQLVEIQCHSKLATRRFQKPKKGLKPDGSDDNGDATPASSAESPLLWIRADPEMEYLAEIHFNQPVQMWINQLEKDKDVVAQSQAVASLVALPQILFSVIGALNNLLCNSKAFWRVRIDAAYALANTASEETDWAGLLHLVKFFKSRRFDANIGLPKPNDFHDIPEYFVLEAIPHAIAMVRTIDDKSPREAVEFVLQLLKYNDNSGNPYSDVFWLAALLQSVGELEFGPQSIPLLSSLLKHIDRILQFDRLMPSYNGILTISCIRTLTQLALKLSGYIPLDRVVQLIKPFRNSKTIWQVRIEASRALLDLELHCKGIDATLMLFITYLEEEPYLRGHVKLVVHAMRLCQVRGGSDSTDEIRSQTLVALLHLLEGREAFNNVFLRHHLYCILQVLATRPPTLYGVPRDRTFHAGDIGTCSEQKNIFGTLATDIKTTEPPPPMDLVAEMKAPELLLVTEAMPAEPPVDTSNPENLETVDLIIHEVLKETDTISNNSHECKTSKEIDTISKSHEHQITRETESISHDHGHEQKNFKEISSSNEPKITKEADTTTSNSHERRMPIVKFRVKHSGTTSRAAETVERSQGGHNETNRGGSSSVSVDAPPRNEAVTISNHNHEEVNSFQDQGSQITASICSAKFASDGDELGRELQCTADSNKCPRPDDPSSPSFIQDNNVDAGAQKFVSLQSLSAPMVAVSSPRPSKDKDKKRDKEKKRKGRRDDPEYLERKRLKKEKKHREKEIAKQRSEANEVLPNRKSEIPVGVQLGKREALVKTATVNLKPVEASGSNPMVRTEVSESGSAPKFRIKIKNRFLNKS